MKAGPAEEAEARAIGDETYSLFEVLDNGDAIIFYYNEDHEVVDTMTIKGFMPPLHCNREELTSNG